MIFNRRKKCKGMEEELIKTRENLDDLVLYFNQITSFLPVSVCTITEAKIFFDVNNSFVKLSEYSSLDIIGKSIELVFKKKDKIKELVNLVKKSGKIESKETTLITLKGKKIPVRIFCGQKKDSQDKITGYFLTIIDISESKEFQKKLEETVEERTKQLRRRLNELEIFHNMTVGRELKMIELKKEIKELKEKIKK